ncbi:hypothetical protein LRAMOSA08715 [Lichtheimia ramosa]|uniref:Senescence domain-containing protein n=1 Tax=Lichtheimia ramosa TaxID=688394 RepID=A0A077WHT6_9FUNG|nr:hypothetical protein LRAMOSA08715 [Lichtheimia ramosa]
MTQLMHLNTVDRVSLSIFDNGEIEHVGDGHVVVYSDKKHQIILRFITYYGQEAASITLTPQSNAWLQTDTMLVFDRTQGGRWRLDCSASDPDAFSSLQDFLTYFIKYENRHRLRNALAMMNPISCKVTEVIARNVVLEEQENDDPKRPVFMENADFSPGSRKVKLMYRTGDALVAGSDWLAYSIIVAGRALARGIQVQSKKVSSTIEPAEKPLRLSQTDRQYIDTFYNVNRTLLKGAGDLISKATAAAASGINTMYSDTQMHQRDPVQNATRHLGVSLFHAAHNVVAGLAMATGTVLASSRDGVVDMIYKRYGQDAGYLAEKAMGSGGDEIADVLVYFDSRGVARQVFVGPSPPRTLAAPPPSSNKNESTAVDSAFDDEFGHDEEQCESFRSMIFSYDPSEDDADALPVTSSVHPLDSLSSQNKQGNKDEKDAAAVIMV